MSFPFSIVGEIPLDSLDESELDSIVTRVHGGFLALCDCEVEVSGRCVKFNGGIFQRQHHFRYHRLATRGRIEVSPMGSDVLRYDFSTRGSMLFYLAISCVVMAFLLWDSGGDRSVLFLAPVMFAFVFVSYTMEQMRLVTFLELAVRSSPTVPAATSDAQCPVCGESYDPDDNRFDVERYCERCHSRLPQV